MEIIMLLFEEFKKAKGYKNVKLEDHIMEFNDFINERKLIGLNYKTLFSEYSGSNIIELNKSEDDTLVYGTNALMITPYTSKYLDNYLLLEGNVNVTNNGLLYVNNKLLNYRYLDYHFITHNPYNEEMISNFEYLNNFSIGMFGNKKDLDREEKVELLRRKRKLLSRYLFEYKEDNNNYYAVLRKTR